MSRHALHFLGIAAVTALAAGCGPTSRPRNATSMVDRPSPTSPHARPLPGTAAVTALAAGCRPTTPAAARDIAYRPDTLELALARLPPDASPGATTQRSRLLRALG